MSGKSPTLAHPQIIAFLLVKFMTNILIKKHGHSSLLRVLFYQRNT